METYWIPGVYNLTTFGRWEFVELKEIYQMEADFEIDIRIAFNSMIENAGRKNHG